MSIKDIALEFCGRGGKKLRPRLCKAVFEKCGGSGDISGAAIFVKVTPSSVRYSSCRTCPLPRQFIQNSAAPDESRPDPSAPSQITGSFAMQTSVDHVRPPSEDVRAYAPREPSTECPFPRP